MAHSQHFHFHQLHKKSHLAMAEPILQPRQENFTAPGADHTGFATLFPFSTGLHGVDQDSNYLYAHVLVITFIVILIATLALRWTKMFIAQLRHMSVLGNPLKQKFWADNK